MGRKEWCKDFNFHKLVEDLGNDIKICYSGMKGGTFYDPRVTLWTSCRFQLPDGAHGIAGKSIELPAIPKNKSNYRVDLFLVGWLCEPVSGGTKVTFLRWCNAGIPSWKKKWLETEVVGNMLAPLRAYVE